MSGIEEKCTRFVLKNYKPGMFDTQKAFHEWKNRNNIHLRKRHRGFYWSGAVASCCFAWVSVFIGLCRKRMHGHALLLPAM